MAGLYAVGALSPEEATAFEAYLETSPEARAEVAEFLATTAKLGEAEAEPPPAALKDRVLADVTTTRQEAPVVTALVERRSRWHRLGPAIAAAAAVLLLSWPVRSASASATVSTSWRPSRPCSPRPTR